MAKTQIHCLPTELTIYSLGALHPQCLAWLDEVPKSRGKRQDTWPLDGASVNEVDAAGVQLLVSLAHSLKERKRMLRLVNASQPLVEACQVLGVTSLLDAKVTHE
ncbi:MAG: STAS domain-containing protein [Steroidobacteraceae bacterium]